MKDLHVLLVLLAFVVTIHGFTRFNKRRCIPSRPNSDECGPLRPLELNYQPRISIAETTRSLPATTTTRTTTTSPATTTTPVPASDQTTTMHCYQLLRERYPVLDNNFWDLFFNDNLILRLQAERDIIRVLSESSILSNQSPLTPTQETTQFPLKRVDFLSRTKRSRLYPADCYRYAIRHGISYDACLQFIKRYGNCPVQMDKLRQLISSLESTTTTRSSTTTTTTTTTTTSKPKPTTTTTTSKPKPTTTTTKLPQVTTPVPPESFTSNRALECYDLLGERYHFLADILWDMAVNNSDYYMYYDESEITMNSSNQNNKDNQIPKTTTNVPPPTLMGYTTTTTLPTTTKPTTTTTTTNPTTTATTTKPKTTKNTTTSTTKQTSTTAPTTTKPTTTKTTKLTAATRTTKITITKPTTTAPTIQTTKTPTTTTTTTPTTTSPTTEECPEITTIQCYNLLSELYPVVANNLRDVFFNDSQIVRQQAEKEINRLLNDSSIQINQIPPMKMPEDTDTFQQEWLLSCKVVDCYNLLIEGYPFLEDMLWGMVMELEKSYSNDSINFHLYANDNHDNATNTKHENAT